MFTIYGTDVCSFCNKAKALILSKGMEFEFKLIGEDISKEELLTMCPVVVKTVPQIFKDNYYIGGYTAVETYLTTELEY